MSKIKKLGLFGGLFVAVGTLGYVAGNLSRDRIQAPRNDDEKALVDARMKDRYDSRYSISKPRSSPSIDSEIVIYALGFWPFFYRSAKRESENRNHS